MNHETARELVRYIATHMERESSLLYPDPNVIMHEPYGLLGLIRSQAQLTPETIDEWMVQAQLGALLGPEGSAEQGSSPRMCPDCRGAGAYAKGGAVFTCQCKKERAW